MKSAARSPPRRSSRRTSRRRGRRPRGRRDAPRRSRATRSRPPSRAGATTRRPRRRSTRTSWRSQPDFSPNDASSSCKRGYVGERAGRPAWLLPRVLHVVVGGVHLDRARERVFAARVVAAEPARVHVPDVQARDPFDDPLGDELPHASGSREPVGAETGRHPEAADVGLAEDELAVRRERLGPVDEAHDFGLLELGHADDSVRHEALRTAPNPPAAACC